MKHYRSITSLIGMISLAATIGLFIHCAHPVTPSGGPKDITPPIVISSNPPAKSVNFASKKITLFFNEFIQLKDPAKEIFISPPMRLRPDFTVKGKSLQIQFNENLKENATYSIYFGKAIADIREGNAASGYEFVFSTGPQIDSLTLQGYVINAFDLKPELDVLVMLYLTGNDSVSLDSLPYRVVPRNVTRTDSAGYFRLSNLKNERYKIFALKDLNNNYLYDLPGEMIAFVDSLVSPVYIPPEIEKPDTSKAPKTEIAPGPTSTPESTSRLIDLYLFEEIDSTQKLLDASLIGNRRIQYAFSYPIDSVRLRPLDFQPAAQWNIREFSTRRDTVTFWLLPPIPDTFHIEIREGFKLCDTNRFALKKEVPGGVFRKKKQEVFKLAAIPNLIAGKKELNQDLILLFSAPLLSYDFSTMRIFTKQDTIVPSVTFDDPAKRRLVINVPWKPDLEYGLFFPDSVFKDIYGDENDTTKITFKTKKLEDYGNIILNVKLPDPPVQSIIQLVNDKDAVFSQDIIDNSHEVRFDYIHPGFYRLKDIHDLNRNRRWDTGNYKKKLQPEPVQYFPKTMSIRANWELQETWEIK